MDLIQEFQEATAKSKQLSNQSNENLLKLYSLFKQATEGDVNIEKPANPFDLVGSAKFNAWDKLKGIAKDDAMKQYIELVKILGN